MTSPSRYSVVHPEAVEPARQVLGRFADTLTANFALLVEAHAEDQLKAPVADLVAEIGRITGLLVSSRTEVPVDDIGGRPDLGVTRDGLLAGNIELKAPGRGATPERFTRQRDRRQWERFKALPNLVYTDGREWSLRRTGEPAGSPVRFGFDPTSAAADDVTADDAAALLDLLALFFEWKPTAPSAPAALAAALAPLTRLLRDEVLIDVRASGPLSTLRDEWQRALFPDVDDAQFADAYAQTFAYALLIARLEGAADPLTAAGAAAALTREHGLLATVLTVMAQPQAREAVRMPVELLERVVGAVDSQRLARRGDPWLYFYEQFLAAYDPQQRNDRGVYFTPKQVVGCQVRLIDAVLTDLFDLPDGIADDGLMFLDPAVGTGTYPLMLTSHALAKFEQYGQGVQAEVASRLAASIHAFEILVGPYAVAQLRLTQRLRDAGATVPADGVQVYLTDTLAPSVEPGYSRQVPLFERPLAVEQERASSVKSRVRVVVCLGNPPYNRDNTAPRLGARRRGGVVRYGDGATPALIADYTDPLTERTRQEHALNLYNDYVYFWRWATHKVFEQSPEPGVVCFISSSAFLRGPGFAGMREHLRRTCDRIWVLDLGGSAPDDENVFDITTAVAITLAVRVARSTPEQRDEPATVQYRRLTGARARKFEVLDGLEDLDGPEWQTVPDDWQAPLVPAATGAAATWPALTDLFPWRSRGIQFSRSWPIGESREVCERRWERLVAAPDPDKPELLKESRDAHVNRRRTSFLTGQPLAPLLALTAGSEPDGIRMFSFRSFDRQWCVADARVIDLPRAALWRADGPRQAYFSFLAGDRGPGPALVVHTGVPDLNATKGNGGGFAFPLWRDPEGRTPNATTGLLAALTESLGTDMSQESLIAYTYFLLSTQAYAALVADAGVQGPPPVPITKDPELFRAAETVGRDLLWWHTWGERFQPTENGRRVRRLPAGTARHPVPVTGDYPESYAYDPEQRLLTVGNGQFSSVAPELWQYEISGFRPLKSWLDYRMRRRAGRTSSPLDTLRPERWAFSQELLTLVHILEHTLEVGAAQADLSERILAAPVFTADELPVLSGTDAEEPAAEPAQPTLGG